MFKANVTHLQQSLFGIENQLSEKKRIKLFQSKEACFYNLLFCSIDENDFASLFSESGSRPNTPVNILVSSIILQNQHGWTGEELLNHIDFDLLTRTALGLHDLDETPFCETTFYNFQNKLLTHFTQTGENLLETIFDKLTEKQLKALQIKASIQRMDSFQALSNIRSYSRIQLLVEMIIRSYRILDEDDRKELKTLLSPYTSKTSSKYIYNLDRSAIPHELEKLGAVYHQLYTYLKEKYSTVEFFKIFERVYTEHFTMVSDKLVVKDSKELTSGSLQSPDDIDATYRNKRGEGFHGQVVNVTETAHPDNELNLITDVVVTENNTDDSTILNNRIDTLKEKTPDLEELHTDGGYGSGDNDQKMETNHINHIQTAVRGRDPKVEIRIEEVSPHEHIVRCPKQTVHSERTKKRYKACFNSSICDSCPYCEDCSTIVQRDGRVYYFDDAMVRLHKRIDAIKNIPVERQTIRPNVEATMKEYSKVFNHKGKLRVRGKFKTMLVVFARSIAINFGRIYRCIVEKIRKKSDNYRKMGLTMTKIGKLCKSLKTFLSLMCQIWKYIMNTLDIRHFFINFQSSSF